MNGLWWFVVKVLLSSPIHIGNKSLPSRSRRFHEFILWVCLNWTEVFYDRTKDFYTLYVHTAHGKINRMYNYDHINERSHLIHYV